MCKICTVSQSPCAFYFKSFEQQLLISSCRLYVEMSNVYVSSYNLSLIFSFVQVAKLPNCKFLCNNDIFQDLQRSSLSFKSTHQPFNVFNCMKDTSPNLQNLSIITLKPMALAEVQLSTVNIDILSYVVPFERVLLAAYWNHHNSGTSLWHTSPAV